MKKLFLFTFLSLFLIGGGCANTNPEPDVQDGANGVADLTGRWDYAAPAGPPHEHDHVTFEIEQSENLEDISIEFSALRISPISSVKYIDIGFASGTHVGDGKYELTWEGDRFDHGVAFLTSADDGALSWESDILTFDRIYTLPTRMTFYKNERKSLTEADHADIEGIAKDFYEEVVSFEIVTEIVAYHAGVAKLSIQPADSVAEPAYMYMELVEDTWMKLLGPVDDNVSLETLDNAGVPRFLIYL